MDLASCSLSLRLRALRNFMCDGLYVRLQWVWERAENTRALDADKGREYSCIANSEKKPKTLELLVRRKAANTRALRIRKKAENARALGAEEGREHPSLTDSKKNRERSYSWSWSKRPRTSVLWLRRDGSDCFAPDRFILRGPALERWPRVAAFAIARRNAWRSARDVCALRALVFGTIFNL